jgi:hypothetical protein
MPKLLSAIGLTLGSYLGWRLGSAGGLITGALVSAIGAGMGLYAAQRFAKTYRG